MHRKTIEVDPNDIFSYLGLSMIYCELGEHGEELLEIEKAIGKDPSDIGFHRYRAGCLRELGRENEALQEDEIIKELVKNRNETTHQAAGGKL